jgi:fermentation-respiration switch protein FrsA (DUF1100 family)
MRRAMTSTLIALLLGYAAVSFFVWLMQDRFLYFPTRDHAGTPDTVGLPYEEIWLIAEDGVRLHAWFIPAPHARATMLFLHGNGGNISHRLARIGLLHRLGVDVFVVDYRGYGKSEGRAGEEGTYRDARAARQYLVEERSIPAASIVLYGESLGAAVAVRLAVEYPPKALIVDSGFTSVADLGAEIYPWLPIRWMARNRYPSRDTIARVTAPILVIHSREDEIIPFHHGQRLFTAAREPKRLLEIHGGHNDGFLVSGAQYIKGIDVFLRSLPGTTGHE